MILFFQNKRFFKFPCILGSAATQHQFICRQLLLPVFHAYKNSATHHLLLRRYSEQGRSHFSKTSNTSFFFSFFHHHQHAFLAFTYNNSQAFISVCRVGTLSRSMRMPTSPLALISAVEQMIPAAPISCMPTRRRSVSLQGRLPVIFFPGRDRLPARPAIPVQFLW